ncbi:DUF982 domain-containing protein [Rhizobium sp. RAF56]|uniref:DUF982 domain-containing protein n=1 Tax=Rhizobium sp. RAF56 TaxID=3233062 RepID=UPI003F9C2283
MALDFFDRPIYAKRKYFIQEITGLDEVLEFLDEWPADKRNLAYEAMSRLCRQAAGGTCSAEVLRENFRRFLKQNDKLAEIQDMSPFLRRNTDRNIGGSGGQ